MNAFVAIALAIPWLLVALGCWLGFQLMRQNGRILLRLEALEQELARLGASQPAVYPALEPLPEAPRGLPIGTSAPEFELPDLSGAAKTLSQYRGQRLLLVFFNPRCGYCVQMAPGIAALPRDSLTPLIVSTGDAEENRQLAREHQLRCPVLLQKGMEIAALYGADGTPMGYLVDEEGRIASEMAIGGDALLSVGSRPAPHVEPTGQERQYKGNRPLSESHLERDGLPKGTPAPAIRLPRIDGGELTLEELRGRPVLLVFSDPHCGPCDELMPRLEQLSQERRDVQVVVVSRGEIDENQEKVRQFGLSFPVALQRKWEISRLYGMFGTPIGYLIDAQGTIAADVAVGAQPILDLLSASPPALNGKSRSAKEVAPMK